jgi:hypothetical protein
MEIRQRVFQTIGEPQIVIETRQPGESMWTEISRMKISKEVIMDVARESLRYAYHNIDSRAVSELCAELV